MDHPGHSEAPNELEEDVDTSALQRFDDHPGPRTVSKDIWFRKYSPDSQSTFSYPPAGFTAEEIMELKGAKSSFA